VVAVRKCSRGWTEFNRIEMRQHNTDCTVNLALTFESDPNVESEGEKKRNQQSEAKSKDNQAEAGTKPGAGSRVTH
jgi:hypothetical protein